MVGRLCCASGTPAGSCSSPDGGHSSAGDSCSSPNGGSFSFLLSRCYPPVGGYSALDSGFSSLEESPRGSTGISGGTMVGRESVA